MWVKLGLTKVTQHTWGQCVICEERGCRVGVGEERYDQLNRITSHLLC